MYLEDLSSDRNQLVVTHQFLRSKAGAVNYSIVLPLQLAKTVDMLYRNLPTSLFDPIGRIYFYTFLKYNLAHLDLLGSRNVEGLSNKAMHILILRVKYKKYLQT